MCIQFIIVQNILNDVDGESTRVSTSTQVAPCQLMKLWAQDICNNSASTSTLYNVVELKLPVNSFANGHDAVVGIQREEVVQLGLGALRHKQILGRVEGEVGKARARLLLDGLHLLSHDLVEKVFGHLPSGIPNQYTSKRADFTFMYTRTA